MNETKPDTKILNMTMREFLALNLTDDDLKHIMLKISQELVKRKTTQLEVQAKIDGNTFMIQTSLFATKGNWDEDD